MLKPGQNKKAQTFLNPVLQLVAENKSSKILGPFDFVTALDMLISIIDS